MIGGLVVVAGTLFQLITQAMSKQAQTSLDGMSNGFPGMFPTLQTGSFLNPFIGLIIGIGVVIIFIGLGIFLYGRYRRQNA